MVSRECARGLWAKWCLLILTPPRHCRLECVNRLRFLLAFPGTPCCMSLSSLCDFGARGCAFT